jgi:hypothetical protein
MRRMSNCPFISSRTLSSLGGHKLSSQTVWSNSMIFYLGPSLHACHYQYT